MQSAENTIVAPYIGAAKSAASFITRRQGVGNGDIICLIDVHVIKPF